MITPRIVTLTEEECAKLIDRASSDHPLPLVFGPFGVAIERHQEGSTWALNQLLDIRQEAAKPTDKS